MSSRKYKALPKDEPLEERPKIEPIHGVLMHRSAKKAKYLDPNSNEEGEDLNDRVD